jgi:hypothetical protein
VGTSHNRDLETWASGFHKLELDVFIPFENKQGIKPVKQNKNKLVELPIVLSR